MVDVDGPWATTETGDLKAADYPHTAVWYQGSSATWGAAETVTINSSHRVRTGVNGVMPVAASLTQWQERERAGGRNPSEKSVTCSCADPVDTFTGEFYENFTDLSLPGAGPAVGIDRSYSSGLADIDGPFG
jgi:hypothetical protein